MARGEQDALGKLHEAERAAAEEAAGLRLEISKLEAALAGAEASKKELLTHAFQAGAFARAGEHSSTGDFAAMAARAAEAEARLAATEVRSDASRSLLVPTLRRLPGTPVPSDMRECCDPVV